MIAKVAQCINFKPQLPFNPFLQPNSLNIVLHDSKQTQFYQSKVRNRKNRKHFI